ncbi:MAG: PHB depolymerase family esterase [Actinomycetota bacterium]|nr:PHB depolymerase family esterase [Actinomycetota bacterium]
MRVRLAQLVLGPLLLLGIVAPPTALAASRGHLSHHSWSQPGGLTRGYLLYVPAGLAAGRPVVVFLHGCNETAREALAATRFNALADREKFAVVYPEQVRPASGSAPVVDGNGLGCWNWFLTDHQARGAGEPAVLAGMAQHVTRTLHADRRRVYVEGISAGADMSVILAASYPDVFAAAASLAGCSYRTCGDGSGQLTYEAMGPRARLVPMFVENGTADVPNPAAQSEGLVQSWLGLADHVDDGMPNGSFSRQPASSITTTPSGTPSPGGGDACVHNNSFLCLGGAFGLSDYPVTRSTWLDAKGRDVLELWLVHGLAHAHPHAPGDGAYTDPLGPDITRESYRFFLKHRLS